MKSEFDIEAVKARKKEIAQAIETLQQESHELDVAMAVFRRFSPAIVRDASSDDDSKLGPPRPAGVPTLFEMAYTVISDAEQRGRKGLTGKEVVKHIAKQYWPGLQGPQITPSLYGFAKKGRLRKTSDGLFQTVRTKEAPTEQSESASRPENSGTANADMFSKT